MRFTILHTDNRTLRYAVLLVGGREYPVELRGTSRPERPRHNKLLWLDAAGVEYSLLCPRSYFRRWTWTLRRAADTIATGTTHGPNYKAFWRFGGSTRSWVSKNEKFIDQPFGRKPGVYSVDGSRQLATRAKRHISVAHRPNFLGGDSFAVAGIVFAGLWNPWHE
jgi:hypothetical protein